MGAVDAVSYGAQPRFVRTTRIWDGFQLANPCHFPRADWPVREKHFINEAPLYSALPTPLSYRSGILVNQAGLTVWTRSLTPPMPEMPIVLI